MDLHPVKTGPAAQHGSVAVLLYDPVQLLQGKVGRQLGGVAVDVFGRLFSPVVELSHDASARGMNPTGGLVEQAQVGPFIQNRLSLVRALLPVHAHVAGDDQPYFVLCQLHQSVHPGGGQLAVRLRQVFVGGRADHPVFQFHGANPARPPQETV